MHLPLFLAVLCSGMISAAPTPDHSLDTRWRQWLAAHKRRYGVREEEWRRAVWEKNMQMIEKHNREYSQGKHGFTMAMNAYGDMTNEEFRLMMNGFENQNHKRGEEFHNSLLFKIPAFLDWRERGYVTPVKNQELCGSSWAFSATGALEGQMFRKTGRLVSLSEQNLVDCSWPQGNQGCSGGLMDYAFQYVKDNRGLDSEESYPYEQRKGSCKYNPRFSAANVTGFVDVSKDEKALMEAVATVGPVSVGIATTPESFLFYEGGIYYDPKCSSENVNHAVLVVGYGFEEVGSKNNKYWLIKNRIYTHRKGVEERFVPSCLLQHFSQ
ncbi:procathepsin L isoform X2 [Oryctolagus cuniculus]|uniref:procathepsin L isoform X2 n=1 Tax=Oryctolagus cuniculus TaxID=9986 RepID=UPI0004908942|nr:procathepsin L isoform X2 [Oryctolagus cuniculus]